MNGEPHAILPDLHLPGGNGDPIRLFFMWIEGAVHQPLYQGCLAHTTTSYQNHLGLVQWPAGPAAEVIFENARWLSKSRFLKGLLPCRTEYLRWETKLGIVVQINHLEPSQFLETLGQGRELIARDVERLELGQPAQELGQGRELVVRDVEPWSWVSWPMEGGNWRSPSLLRLRLNAAGL
jgi:hypothetical protein